VASFLLAAVVVGYAVIALINALLMATADRRSGIALDWSALPSGPVWIYLTILGTAVALTFATILIATSLALRARPVEVGVLV
jgi:putative ABC transport system permease protein